MFLLKLILFLYVQIYQQNRQKSDQGNNFHNCNLVFLLQHGASPSIVNNNVETCLIGFICGARAFPKVQIFVKEILLNFFVKVEQNLFHCILMSIGMFIEGSRGTVTKNIFQYVANMIVLS